ncbi:hypothetical protein F4811DRAFT_567811 [Daldinia bambusicola]|nr:hypothetical protein F4811DRAFT_567811 [Daldinia bambusicola]
MATTTKQRLALAICDFLSTSLTDGTLSAEDKDSIDVAINCIAESFKVDPADPAAVSAAAGTQNLLQIYGVYEKLKTTTAAAAKPAAAAAAAAASPSSSNTADKESENVNVKEPTGEEKARAEDLKARGNRAMASKDYPAAIDLYTQALALHPRNPIYLSNRAAAYSAARDHASARADAEAAVAIDPKYTKAWSRLGLARFALGDAKGSMEAYQLGIEHEGNGGSEAMKKGFETAKRRVEELEAETGVDSARGGAGAGGLPDLGGLASLLGGGGGGGGGAGGNGGSGGGGGFPDLSSIMSNPMFASMAQNLMSNPEMMQNLMSNPRLREMADRFSSGGGMPDLSSLMSDPNIADMARNMMGGGGGADGAGGNPGAGRGAGR